MLENSFIGSIFNMTAQVYNQSNAQLPSGAMQRDWKYSKTIQCKIEPLSQRGASVKGDGEQFGLGADGYVETLQLKMKTFEYLSKRQRITAIRSSDNRPVFLEVQKISQDDMIFDVVSCHPVLDPFGKISHYSVNIRRVPVQNDSTGV